jgi:hypothetical protein
MSDSNGQEWAGLSGTTYGGASLLLLAESQHGLERLRQRADAAGRRVSAAALLDESLELLDRQIAVDAVVMAIEREVGQGAEAALSRLGLAAGNGRYRSVVAAPPELIDIVFARAPEPGVELLCEATELEWATAIAAATAPLPAVLNDVSKGSATPRLQQLSEEILRIANILASMSEEERAAAAVGRSEADEGPELEAAYVRSIIRARRLRDQFFRSDIFADPAWDMLLDLMAARLERQRVAVSSLCIASAVPPTTALRWIKALSDQGLFVRVSDPEDGRRVFIELSEVAASSMTACLKAVQRIAPSII